MGEGEESEPGLLGAALSTWAAQAFTGQRMEDGGKAAVCYRTDRMVGILTPLGSCGRWWMESWLGTCDLGSTAAPALYTTPSSPESGVCVLALSQHKKLTCPVPLFPFFMKRPWIVVEQGLPSIADRGPWIPV